MASPTTSITATDGTCRYAGKKCDNERAVKRNGALHNLCHYHRVRANQNQRRMELRRRLTRTREDRGTIAVGGLRSFGYDITHAIHSRSAASLQPPPSPAFLLDTHASAGFSALLQDAAVAAATWGYYAPASTDPVTVAPPAHDALLHPLSPHDHLSELFSETAPESSQSTASLSPFDATNLLSHVPSRFPKQLLGDSGYDDEAEEVTAQLRFQYMAALSSPVSPGHPVLLMPSVSPSSSASMTMAMGFDGRSPLDLISFPEHPQVIWCDQELLL